MPDLTEDQKILIVLRLACFVRPTRIMEELEDEHKVTIKYRSQISFYDPSTVQGRSELSPELTKLFWATRSRFLEDQSAIGVSHRLVRLKMLDDLLDHPTVLISPRLQMEIAKQAAQEVGGQFEAKITEGEVDTYIAGMQQKLREALDKHVTNTAERDRVCAEIQKIVEEEG